ncbi:hypothetical protein EYF80_053871 [Liparis tanakae]|uniref:Uncharacterized protein n=1 Tax=Liparis tanakae TaxID=230148 RepID=A0A4Z2F3Z8_9TELE|nr:hypothetical protein EYF80_053871 [Liparis tanakae]
MLVVIPFDALKHIVSDIEEPQQAICNSDVKPNPRVTVAIARLWTVPVPVVTASVAALSDQLTDGL